MKKIYISFLFLSTLSVGAQSIIQLTHKKTDIDDQVVASPNQVITPNLVISAGTSASLTTKVTVDIMNASSATQTFNVIRYDMALYHDAPTNSDATAFYCIAGTCYGAGVIEAPSPLVLRAGKKASDTTAPFFMLAADLLEAYDEGYSLVKYTIFNVNNKADSVQFSIQYNGTGAGIKTATPRNLLAVYPNPANTNLFVENTGDSPLQFIISDITGRIVLTKAIAPGKETVDISSLPKGIYFVDPRNGGKDGTKKLIVE